MVNIYLFSISILGRRELRPLYVVHIMATLGHLRVSIGHLRLTIGNFFSTSKHKGNTTELYPQSIKANFLLVISKNLLFFLIMFVGLL